MARRRRDGRSLCNSLFILLVLWLSFSSIAPTISHLHPLLPPHFVAIANPNGARGCLPASHLRPSPWTTLQASKIAKLEVLVSDCSFPLLSNNCFFYLHRSTCVETIPGILRRNILKLATFEEPLSIVKLHKGKFFKSKLYLFGWHRSLPLLAPKPQLPAMFLSCRFIILSPVSRHREHGFIRSKKLGFEIMGLSLFSPFTPFWTILRNGSPSTPIAWPRSDFLHLSSSLFLSIIHHIVLSGRRHRLWPVSTSLEKLVDYPPTDLKQSSLATTHNRNHLRFIFTLRLWIQFCPEKSFHRFSLMARDNPGPLLASYLVRLSRTHDFPIF